MKRITLLIALATLLLTSCSPVKKAEKLIKKEMPTLLAHPESYEPIATRLDSTFAPMETQEFVQQLQTIRQLQKQIEHLNTQKAPLTDQLHSCQWLLDNYAGNANNPNIQQRIAQKQEEAEHYTTQLEELNKQIEEQQQILDLTRQNARNLMQQEKQFNGYRATHTYQHLNEEGQFITNDHVFLLTPDLKAITYQTTRETYDQGIHQLNQTIRELQ